MRTVWVWVLACFFMMALGPAARANHLFKELGNEAGIATIVDKYIDRVVNDPRFGDRFKGANIQKIKAFTTSHLCREVGGPCRPAGPDMRTAHKGMGITQKEYDAMVDNMRVTLDEFKLWKGDKHEVIQILERWRNDVVEKKTLFDRLGGLPGITAVIDDFLAMAQRDRSLDRALQGTDYQKLRRHLIDQICEAAGGPCTYKGLDMKAAHAGMGITTIEFNTAFKHLGAALTRHNVGEHEQWELVTLMLPFRKDIVEKP